MNFVKNSIWLAAALGAGIAAAGFSLLLLWSGIVNMGIDSLRNYLMVVSAAMAVFNVIEGRSVVPENQKNIASGFAIAFALVAITLWTNPFGWDPDTIRLLITVVFGPGLVVDAIALKSLAAMVTTGAVRIYRTTPPTAATTVVTTPPVATATTTSPASVPATTRRPTAPASAAPATTTTTTTTGGGTSTTPPSP